ncbi:hypothetical protein LBMAG42_55190 [Deltaproteobacteria bacterium]|nr:hypothetical protein LBMAG42_55190 [Deltaproteobacteria bacterium]
MSASRGWGLRRGESCPQCGKVAQLRFLPDAAPVVALASEKGPTVTIHGVPVLECAQGHRSAPEGADILAGGLQSTIGVGLMAIERASPRDMDADSVTSMCAEVTLAIPGSRGKATGRFLREFAGNARSLEDMELHPDTLEDVEAVIASERKREWIGQQLGPELADQRETRLVLFSSPPGLGKTTLARVIATKLGRPLRWMDLSTIESKWSGESEKALTAAFEEARELAAIVLIDEADAVCRRRTEDAHASAQAQNAIRSHLIQVLDAHGDLVLMATNLPKNIDDAIRSRVTAEIAIAELDAERRRSLWLRWLRATRLAGAPSARWVAELDERVVNARLPSGFSPRDMEKVIRVAVNRAARAENPVFERRHVERALEARLKALRSKGLTDADRLAASARLVAGFGELGRAARDSVRAKRHAASATMHSRAARGSPQHVVQLEAAVGQYRAAADDAQALLDQLAHLAGAQLERDDEPTIRGLLARLRTNAAGAKVAEAK